MEPILVYPIVYVLKLENDKYYVGITTNLNYRVAQHLNGSGANWTRLHKPISIIETILNSTHAMENEVTKRYIEQYGKENVRGGSWTKV